MKRFFAVTGFSFVFTLILMNLLAKNLYFVIGAIALLGLISLLFKKVRSNVEIPAVILSALLAAVVFTVTYNAKYLPSMKYKNKSVNITATVLDSYSFSSSGNFSYLIETKEIDSKEEKIKMQLYVPYDVCSNPYDEIKFTATPFLLGENNESQYLYFRSKGTYLGVYSDMVYLKTVEEKPPLYYLLKFKIDSEKILRTYLSDDFAEFAISIMFGDKSRLSQEKTASFRLAGLSHIMAVSGLHLSLWALGLFEILKKFHIGKRLSSLISIVFAFFIMCCCAFSASIVRAFIMLSLLLIGDLFARKSDGYNSLGLAGLLICLFNPFAVCDPSFLLSFFATLAVLVFAEFAPQKLNPDKNETIVKRIPEYIIYTVLLSVTVTLFIAPISLSLFGSVSLYTALSNVLCLFAITPCLLISGIITVVPSFITVCELLSKVLVITEKYIFGICDFVSNIPYSSVHINNSYVILFISLCIIIPLMIAYKIKRKQSGSSPILIGFSGIAIAVCYNFVNGRL